MRCMHIYSSDLINIYNNNNAEHVVHAYNIQCNACAHTQNIQSTLVHKLNIHTYTSTKKLYTTYKVHTYAHT